MTKAPAKTAAKPASNTPPPPAPLKPEGITRWLDYICEPLVARREAIIKALIDNAAAYPRIDDDDALGVVAENMRMAAALNRTAEDRRKEYKEPFLTGGRSVDGWFKVWSQPMAKLTGPLQLLMNQYGERKLAIEQAAAREAARLAQIESDRAAELAATALEAGKPAEVELDTAAEAGAAADDANKRATARPAELTRTYGTFGAVASVRQKWKWRCVDISKVPAEYLTIDADKITEAARARDSTGKPLAVIPGIEFYPETSVGVR